MQLQAPKLLSDVKSEIEAYTLAAGLEWTQQTLSRNLQEAEGSRTKYAGAKEVVI